MSKINLKLVSKKEKMLVCSIFLLASLLCSMVGYAVAVTGNSSSSATGITRVQYTRGTAFGGTTVSAALTSSPSVGDLLIAVIGADGASQAVKSIAEPGVVWTQQVSAYYAGAQASSSIWAGVIGAGASSNLIVTFASAVGTGAGVNVCEYSGLKTSGFLDRTANNSYTNNPTYSGPYSTGTTDTTTSPTELCVGTITLSDSSGFQVSPLNGFALIDGALIGGFVSVSYLENMVSAYGTYSSGTSASSSGGGWVGCIATFQAAPPAPQSTTPTTSQYSFLVEQQGSSFLAINGTNNQIALNSTDAASVLNYATTYANGVVYVLNGNYPLNASVNVYSDDPLIGESQTGVNLYLVAGTVANVIQAINQKNVTIEDLTVNPNNILNPRTGTPASSAERLQCGISLQGCSVGLIQNVNELNAGWDGIQVYNSANVVISQCTAYKNSWHGIQLWSCTGFNIIEGCTASYVGAANAGIVDELAVGSSTAIATITENTVSNCNQGIFVDSNGISTTNVVNNQLFNNTIGVDVQLSSNVQVTGNLINQPSSAFTGPGIFVQYTSGAGCSNGIVSQNTIVAYGHGIFVDSVNEFIISDNNIQGKATSGRSGIYVNGSATNGNFGSIDNNIIYNFVLGVNITGSKVVNAVISNNQFNNVTTKITDLGTSTRIFTNLGYNSIGHITNPISSSGTTLVDSGSSNTWVSARTYTNSESSKVLYISGGTVSAIIYDGITLFTSATTCNIVLQPGDTFSVTFSSAPKIEAFGQ